MPMAPRSIRARHTVKRVERRPNSHQRGYKWKTWQKHRKARIAMLVLRDGPMCGICHRLLPSQSRDIHIDHKVAPSTMGPVGSTEYQRWFDDEDNWQLACGPCNSSKQDR